MELKRTPGQHEDEFLLSTSQAVEAGLPGIYLTLFVADSMVAGRVCNSSEFFTPVQSDAAESPGTAESHIGFIHLLNVRIVPFGGGGIESIPILRIKIADVWGWTPGKVNPVQINGDNE